ncbi:MAG: hypothetical protein EXR98_11895 [Gemmataceae bacterium]|nr:hypothetical protein [Gemmataceae bacterium]
MGSDMFVALKEASANQTTLFGLNYHTDGSQRHAVHIVPGMMHEAGDVAHAATAEVPEAKQTFAVLGIQPLHTWGFLHGVNENRVAIGVTSWQSRRPRGPGALSGPDLVCLALQRSRGAHHAFEVLTDLLEHYGETPDHGANDHIFLIADGKEAFVLEASGRYWAMLECGSTRAVTDAAMIRQDWRRLAPGLVDFAAEKGWWTDDGTKLDFVRCVAEKNDPTTAAQKRWGHASLALVQQQGAIDLYFLRRMLADQETLNRELFLHARTAAHAGSFLVDLVKPEQPIVAWLAFGPPKIALFFPLCLVGELPAGFAEGTSESPSSSASWICKSFPRPKKKAGSPQRSNACRPSSTRTPRTLWRKPTTISCTASRT